MLSVNWHQLKWLKYINVQLKSNSALKFVRRNQRSINYDLTENDRNT